MRSEAVRRSLTRLSYSEKGARLEPIDSRVEGSVLGQVGNMDVTEGRSVVERDRTCHHASVIEAGAWSG